MLVVLPLVRLLGNTFKLFPILLLIHEPTRLPISLHPIAIRSLELGSVINCTSTKVVARIFAIIITDACAVISVS